MNDKKIIVTLPIVFIILGVIVWQLFFSEKDHKQAIIFNWRSSNTIPGNLIITYPLSGTLFPPEIASPTISWQEKTGDIKNWCIIIHVNQDKELISTFLEEQQWQPDPEPWEQIKVHGLNNDVYITVLGYQKDKILSGAQTIIRTSSD